MPMLMGAFPRLTRHFVAFAAAALLMMVPGIAHADDVAPTSEPSTVATEPAPEADPTVPAPPPSPRVTDTMPPAEPNAHAGGM